MNPVAELQFGLDLKQCVFAERWNHRRFGKGGRKEVRSGTYLIKYPGEFCLYHTQTSIRETANPGR